jgi:hypothetical protein
MSETRRDIFKYSVLGALGLVSVGGVVWYLLTPQPRVSSPGPSDPHATIVGYTNNKWYAFVWDGTGYRVYSTATAYGSVMPQAFPFDTEAFKAAILNQPSTYSFTRLTTGADIHVGGQHFLMTGPYLTTDQVNVLTNSNNTNNMALAHWNEIGQN